MKKFNLLGATLLASTVLMGAGQAFAAEDSANPTPADVQTDIAATLQLPENGGTNPTPPNPVDPDKPNPDQPGNKPDNPSGTFGIAYHPEKFDFKTVALQESGEQIIGLKNGTNDTFHLGVKDKTRNTNGWTVTAKLNGDISKQKGVSIEMGGSSEVKVNQATDSSQSKLVAAPVGSATGMTNVSVTTEPTEVLKGTQGFQHNDVYDWGLGEVNLKLANAKDVQANTYTGTVDWNLSQAASGVQQ